MFLIAFSSTSSWSLRLMAVDKPLPLEPYFNAYLVDYCRNEDWLFDYKHRTKMKTATEIQRRYLYWALYFPNRFLYPLLIFFSFSFLFNDFVFLTLQDFIFLHFSLQFLSNILLFYFFSFIQFKSPNFYICVYSSWALTDISMTRLRTFVLFRVMDGLFCCSLRCRFRLCNFFSLIRFKF